MPFGPLEIKEKSYLTDAPPSDMPTNTVKLLLVRTATLSIQHTCHVGSCYVPAATAATYMPAGLMLLSQTPLLFKHAYRLSTAARWILAGLWTLNQHACWPFVTQYYMSAGIVLLYLCLLYYSAVSAGVVNHYRSCLLVWYITISHACWCGASL